MKFVFLRFRRMEKMDSVMKGLTGAMPHPQNFWARTAPACDNARLRKLAFEKEG